MLDSALSYVSKQAAKQYGRVLFTTHPYLSGVIAISYYFYREDLRRAELSLSSLFAVFLTYNTVVFGFCIAALALAIAIPNEQFLKFISERDEKNRTPYRDLIFVFSWTAVVHWISFVFLFSITIFEGVNYIIPPDNFSILPVFIFYLFAWVQLYALFQFLVNIFTVFEVADLYSQFLSK